MEIEFMFGTTSITFLFQQSSLSGGIVWILLLFVIIAAGLAWNSYRNKIIVLKEQSADLRKNIESKSDELEKLSNKYTSLNDKHSELEKSLEEKEQTISYQSDLLKISDEIKSRFFSNVSHELRTPLTLIKGQIELIMRGEASRKPKVSDLKLVLKYTEHLSKQIDELLHLSKLETSRDVLEEELFDLSQGITLVKGIFNVTAKQKEIEISDSGLDDALFVHGDEKKIELILINLVTNAIMHIGEKGRIDLIVKRQDPEKPEGIIIQVKDNGEALSQNTSERLFQEYETDSNTSRIGMILGLSLVEKWIEMMDGSLTIHSDENFGNSYTITLPLKITENVDEVGTYSEVEENELTSIDAKNGTTQNPNFSDKRSTILLAEDNTRLLKMMGAMLGDEYNVIMATDGLEALDLTKKNLPDVIVTDVMMPKMDGLEFCRNLKKDPAIDFIPVIMLTAKAGMENELKGLEEGGDAYIVKPFHLDILKQTIRNMLQSRKKVWEKSKVDLTKESIKSDLKSQTVLERLNDYLNKHLRDDNLSVADIADALNVTQRHLQRKIKEETGLTPKAYLTKKRLEIARYLIQEGHGSVSEAAYGTGFSNLSHFAKYFKREFGILPSEVK